MIVNFEFDFTGDCNEIDAVIFARVDTHGEIVDYASIEDAIASYIDGADMFGYIELIQDVFNSFGYDVEVLVPSHTFTV